MRCRSLAATLVVLAPLAVRAQDAPLLGLRLDADRNRVFLEVPSTRLGQPLLHQTVLATGAGVGANGLDRGETGASVLVRFERQGKRVLLVRDNPAVRALDGTREAAQAAAESFPRSVIGAFPVEAEAAGTITVDATSLFLSDAYGVAESIRRAQSGNARVDAGRSWIDAARSKAFPRNVEVHAVLTFGVDNPGGMLRRAAPDAASPVFEVHHSFVALPPAQGFTPRRYDPRTGFYGTAFYDFSQPLSGTYRDAYANRWRLVPRDPAAYLRGEKVEPVEPIRYYLDPAVPEPYRTAFLEGGRWWNTVFEAAGWRNAFRVEPLPAGVDPMDARYNLIAWVHRAGPGPSVGPSLTDPRTGEILRTVVRMDSWRSLVDYNIYAGLVPAAGPEGLAMSAEAFAMARRRQHVAHEIGHTIGLYHNYAAKINDRSSVMDYPYPRIDLDAKGNLDIRQAYAPFAGAWDSLAIRWGYTWYPDSASEARGLAAIVAEGLSRGLRFSTDQDAGPGGSMPEITWWLEGRTALEAFARTRAVRERLVARFDERAIAPGEPMALLNMRFAAVYLHHRYALEGVVKTVGGLDYTYAMRGDRQVPTTIVPPAVQRRALATALDALEPAALAVPERVQAMIPPFPPGLDRQFEWIGSAGRTAFDEISLAGGLATEVIEGLMERQRLARVVLFRARDAQQPTLDEVLRTIVDRTWGAAPSTDGQAQSLRRTVQRVVLNTLLDRAGDAQALPDVRQVAALQLEQLDRRLATATGGSPADRALRSAARREIAQFFAGEDDRASRSRFPVIPLPWP